MSKRIKPNAEHRIVDGEVVTSDIDEKIKRGQEYSAEMARQHASESEVEMIVNEEDPESILKDVNPQASISDGLDSTEEQNKAAEPWWAQHKNTILWVLLFVVVVITLVFTRPDTDWQVQKINDLQNEIAQIKQQNQDMEQRLQEQQLVITEQVEEALSKSENRAIVTQQDLENVERQIQQELLELQDKLSSASGQAGEQLTDALSKLSQTSEQLAPKATEQLQKLEGHVQQQLGEVSKKLADLFEFKAEQQVLTQRPPVLKLDMPLDSLQIQQWIVEINTQWLLNGRIDETHQQLLALEQAVALSDFVYTTQLARLIGQDLGYLQQLESQQLENPLPKTARLKDKINHLLAADIKVQQASKNTASPENESGFDGLLDRFSQVITMKKRDPETEMTEVNTLLINDVLKQRLSLLVDRLDWGMDTHSKEVVVQAAADIKAFVQRHYANQFAEFSGLLEPFADIEFPSKKPLSIMHLDKAVNE